MSEVYQHLSLKHTKNKKCNEHILHCLAKKHKAEFSHLRFFQDFFWDAVASEQVQGGDAHEIKEEEKRDGTNTVKKSKRASLCYAFNFEWWQQDPQHRNHHHHQQQQQQQQQQQLLKVARFGWATR